MFPDFYKKLEAYFVFYFFEDEAGIVREYFKKIILLLIKIVQIE